MKFGRLLKIIIGILSMALLCWLWLITPYKYSWDEDLKQPNEDSIAVIRLVTIIICSVSVIFLIRNKSNNRYLNFIFFINLFFAISLLIQTFFV